MKRFASSAKGHGLSFVSDAIFDSFDYSKINVKNDTRRFYDHIINNNKLGVALSQHLQQDDKGIDRGKLQLSLPIFFATIRTLDVPTIHKAEHFHNRQS